MENERVVLFSPEYSPELAKRIKSIYRDDIKHYYPQLKLEKLIDLLEHTQYLFELYMRFINDHNDNDSLTSYIIGCFYIFLIMPRSIQFQTKNKDFGIYTDMKNLYEGQMNMTNVRLMVRDEIDNILDRSPAEPAAIATFTERKRAHSVPGQTMADSLAALNLDSAQSSSAKQLDEVVPRKEGNSSSSSDESQTGSVGAGSVYSSSISSTEQDENMMSATMHNGDIPVISDSQLFAEENETSSQLWTAPAVDTNDQLKIALYPEALPVETLPLTNDFNEPIEFPKGNTHMPSIPHQPLLRARTESVAMSMFDDPSQLHSRITSNSNSPYNALTESPNSSNSELIADRGLTHRKNSYHSVYMMENENDEMKNDDYYDKSNDFIRGLERLERQSIITAPELFSILSNPVERTKLLLIDLRLAKRYTYNNIIADNYVPLDPTLLWDAEKNAPIYDISILEGKLNNALFNNRNSFEYIVYYSDMKTYMKLNFDYHFILFYLLITSLKEDDKFKGAPTALLGGYEKWKKMMHKYTREYDVDARQYMYGPYDKEGKKVVQKTASPSEDGYDAGNQTTTHTEVFRTNRVPEAPSFRPPEVPMRIRKRPPPPPPATRPKSPPPLPLTDAPQLPPRLPPKIKADIPRREPISRMPTHVPVLPSTIPERKRASRFETGPEQKRPLMPRPITFSIPTIEKNPNIYVSLSVTGLRNLGNTCYINSMVQCLFSTKTFRDLFLSNVYERYMNMNNRQIAPNTRKLSLSNSLNILFRKMYLNGGCSVVPIAFLKTCSLLRPDLRIPDDQQDTQEFLMLMLDRLHDELSNQDAIVNENPGMLLYDTDELKVNKKEYKKWFDDNFNANGVSPIDNIFQGQMESCLQCERCGFSTFNYSSFYVLSLAIPKKQKSLTKLSGRINLEDCISMYTADEILSGENAWSCPKCCDEHKKKLKEKRRKLKQPQTLQVPHQKERSREKHSIFKFGGSKKKKSNSISRSLSPFRLIKKSEPKMIDQLSHLANNGNSDNDSKSNSYDESDDEFDEADDEALRHWKNKKLVTVKTLNFISLPKVLVIHLSRFYYDLTKKNSSIITYPLILQMSLKNHKVVKYRLYGIVNHTGNLISGHYTSLINKDYQHSLKTNEQKWYYFDDEVVKGENNHGDIDNGINKVSSKDAYVLFYERIE